MTLRPEAKCPGSGLQMVYRTYRVRQIEERDRAKREGTAQTEEESGDFEAAHGTGTSWSSARAALPGVTLVRSGQHPIALSCCTQRV
jgi:hypothetical protein